AAEHLCTCGSPKMPTCRIPVASLCQNSLVDARDYAAIKQVVAVCSREIEGMFDGPFAHLGWFGELRNWIEAVIEPMGFHVTGEFRQLNASASFSLIRFETDGPALWFKAVGEPNQREFAITRDLAQFFPDYLPRILAFRSDWNGWLTREVQGRLLSESHEQERWERAAAALSSLQRQSLDCGSEKLGAGVGDLGSAALSEAVPLKQELVDALVESQSKFERSVNDREDLLESRNLMDKSVEAMK